MAPDKHIRSDRNGADRNTNRSMFKLNRQTCSPCREHPRLKSGLRCCPRCGSSPRWGGEPSAETRRALHKRPAARPWMTSRCAPGAHSATTQSTSMTLMWRNISVDFSWDRLQLAPAPGLSPTVWPDLHVRGQESDERRPLHPLPSAWWWSSGEAAESGGGLGRHVAAILRR